MAQRDLVFLTGATGFVGSHILRELLAQGYSVRALRRPPAVIPSASAAPVILSASAASSRRTELAPSTLSERSESKGATPAENNLTWIEGDLRDVGAFAQRTARLSLPHSLRRALFVRSARSRGDARRQRRRDGEPDDGGVSRRCRARRADVELGDARTCAQRLPSFEARARARRIFIAPTDHRTAPDGARRARATRSQRRPAALSSTFCAAKSSPKRRDTAE